MDQNQIVAAVWVTVLIAVAFLLSIGAGASALHKWHKYQQRQRDYDAHRDRGQIYQAEQSKRHNEFTKTHPSTEWDAFFEQEAAGARAAGFAPKTAGEYDLENFVGTRPKEAYQAPAEVWVGLLALACATAASIIDVWCV